MEKRVLVSAKKARMVKQIDTILFSKHGENHANVKLDKNGDYVVYKVNMEKMNIN